MKKIIGWLANLYPRHFFYAKSFGHAWDFRLPTGERDSPHETMATTALLGVAVAVGKHVTEVGGSAVATFTSVTDGGTQIGSYRVTVEKIESNLASAKNTTTGKKGRA